MYGGAVVLGFGNSMNGVFVTSVGCNFGRFYTTLEGSMLGLRMEEEEYKSVCGRRVRCSWDLIVHFRFVRTFILFIFKISYLKTASQMRTLGGS